MKLKLSDWASIAEILSGVAVVVTLVFLISSIRANTAALRAETYESNTDDINIFQYEMLRDPDSLRVYEAWLADRGASLDDSDLFRLDMILGVQLRELDSEYSAYRYGQMGEAEWRRLGGPACGIFRGIEAAGRRMPRLTDEFLEYIDESCPELPIQAE